MRIWLMLAAVPAVAHTISMSTGSLEVTGRSAIYRLKMPAWELQHVTDAKAALPAAVRIESADLVSSECTADSMSMTCSSTWTLRQEPGSIRLNVRLAEVTVPNHVHVLRAVRGNLTDQAVFDAANTTAELRFRRAGQVESAIRARPQALLAALLVVLALAARPPLQAAAFFAAALLAYALPLWLTPAFLEAAVAIAVAYACFDLSVYSAGALGLAAGLYAASLYPHAWAAEGAIAVAGAALSLAIVRARQPVRIGAGVAGLLWALAVIALP